MRYERSDSFKSDYKALSAAEQEMFRHAAKRLNAALDERAARPGTAWPTELRVKGVQGAKGVWEMTWNFEDPDGRATWEYGTVDGEPGIRWRRCGDHSIFKRP